VRVRVCVRVRERVKRHAQLFNTSTPARQRHLSGLVCGDACSFDRTVFATTNSLHKRANVRASMSGFEVRDCGELVAPCWTHRDAWMCGVLVVRGGTCLRVPKDNGRNSLKFHARDV
jgi:hypothetical protein